MGTQNKLVVARPILDAAIPEAVCSPTEITERLPATELARGSVIAIQLAPRPSRAWIYAAAAVASGAIAALALLLAR
jgi:hypothetical protein